MDGEDEPTGMYSRRLRAQHSVITEKRAETDPNFLESVNLL